MSDAPTLIGQAALPMFFNHHKNKKFFTDLIDSLS